MKTFKMGFSGCMAEVAGRTDAAGSRFRVGRLAVAMLLTLALSACETVPYGLPGPAPSAPPASQPPATALPAMKGEIIGTGPTRIALLLPMTASGNGARIAAEFRNAAKMAVEDFGLQSMQVAVKDTGGRPEQALAMANEAALEGGAIVLGPLFAAEVTQAASALRPTGKIEIAFSSDRSVAGNGTYLNSFLPEGIVDRSISFAISRGYQRFVALVPNGPAGDLAETQLRATLAAKGGSLLQIARYDYDEASLQTAAASVAPAIGQAQAIFIPDGGGSPNAIAAALRSNGVDLAGRKLVGTGQWTTANLADPALAGAWFADADQGKLATYKTRYRQKFGADPSVNSALAYDTVALVAGIIKRGGAAGFSRDAVEAPTGYAGYTGIFRFLANGTSERGYAVYEVGTSGIPTVVSPAPTSFGAN